jgi:alkylresorcinol/alkylpyrone synthase
MGSFSHLFADSEDVMGWDVVESGLKVRFARSIPAMVHQTMPGLVAQACQTWQIDQAEICHYVAHPGGPKVLEAYSESLNLPLHVFRHALDILKCYGNMSSVSVLFVLEHFLKTTRQADQYGLMMALGPGFSAEQILFRW